MSRHLTEEVTIGNQSQTVSAGPNLQFLRPVARRRCPPRRPVARGVSLEQLSPFLQGDFALAYHGGCPWTLLKVKSSLGRPKRLGDQDQRDLDMHISFLLEAGIIRFARRTAFIASPFLMPKSDGSTRMVVDYSHLRGKYRNPPMSLSAFASR